MPRSSFPVHVYSEALTGTDTGDGVDIQNSDDMVVALIATSAVSLTTVTVLVEHSPDGANWFLLDTFTNVNANATEVRQITDPHFSNIRIRVSVFTGTSVTLNIFAE